MAWYKIDTAGKLFTSVSNKENSSFFRVAAVLHETVDSERLQKAVDAVRPRFSFLFVRIRQGVFWNYFDSTDNPFLVQNETNYPCLTAHSIDIDTQVIRFFYSGCRISIEFFHALTDGSGAFEVLKAILAVYFNVPPDQMEDKVVNLQKTPDITDYENGFFRYADDKKKLKAIKKRSSYRIMGTKFDTEKMLVITGTVPAKELNTYARSIQTTITGYLVSLLIYSLYQSQIKYNRIQKPVVVSVPVNLRKHFTSVTLRNFFVVINITFNCIALKNVPEEEQFKTICESVNSQLTERTTKDNLQLEINRNVGLENNKLHRFVPLKIKHFFIRLGFVFMGEIKKTITLSNTGRVHLPTVLEDKVLFTEFLLYSTAYSPSNCTVTSVNNSLAISFTRSIQETDTIRMFFSLLQQQTELPVSIYGNEGRKNA